MPTPPYIRKLRERIGSDYLWLSGATAVVYREQDSKVLLVRRSDNGAWTPITGIVDPGESPALTCLREAQEEANVQIEVLELAKVNDEESSQVRWVDVSDPAERALLSERMLDRIDAALNYDGHCRFGLESVPPEED